MKTLTRLTLGLSVLALPALTQAETAEQSGRNETTLQCHTVDDGNRRIDWRIQLNESMPLAVVDDDDTPADYSPGHVRVRLEANGPSLVIGRTSGRLVLSAADGATLATGVCVPPLSV